MQHLTDPHARKGPRWVPTALAVASVDVQPLEHRDNTFRASVPPLRVYVRAPELTKTSHKSETTAPQMGCARQNCGPGDNPSVILDPSMSPDGKGAFAARTTSRPLRWERVPDDPGGA